MNLILDIKIYISLFDAYTWLKMWRIDDEFKCYASSDQGISVFINTFVTIIKNHFINGYRITPTLSILNIPHSINDIPETTESGHKIWYYMGKEHRNNDLPAIINSCGDQGWYDQGKNIERMIYLQLFITMVINIGTMMVNYIEKMIYLQK